MSVDIAPPKTGMPAERARAALLRARSVVLVAALVHLAAEASVRLGWTSPALSLLWLPGPLVMAVMLARGGLTPLAAAIGIASWSLSRGHAWPTALGFQVSCVLVPIGAALAMNAWSRWRPTQSNLIVTVRMLLTIAFVFAPLAGLADLLLHGAALRERLGGPEAWMLYTGIQAMSGIVLVRALLSLMPDVPGAVCPIADGRGSLARIRASEVLGHGTVAATGLLAWSLSIGGLAGTAGLLLSSVFIVPVTTALLLERQAASRILITTVVLVVGLHVAARPFDTDPQFMLTMTQMIVLLALCGIALHLLNASTAERNEQRLRLERLAFTSDLTGLPNGHALVQAIEARLGATPPLAFRLAEVAVPDLASPSALDGVEAGAAVERRVAHLLQQRFPQAYLIAHTGTGRFAMLLPPSLPDADLRRAMASGVTDADLGVGAASRAYRLRCSMGVVEGGVASEGDIARAPELLRAASMARKEAWTRPDRFCSIGASDPSMRLHRERMRGVSMTRRALDAGRPKLLGQPILPTRGTSPTLHYEVLARLLDDEGRDISPAIFLPALASEHMLEEFDRLVLDRTLGTLASDTALRQVTGLAAINITGPTLADPGFPALLARLLADHGVDPSIVSLEITESDSIANLEIALRNAARLGELGISIAVDDFGTGFATFDYLRKFTPQWLKIDGSFVRDFDDSPLSREIIVSMVRVAHAVGARTVAEAVENRAIALKMAELGVDYLQGWALARPMPIADLARFGDGVSGGGRRERAEAGEAAGA
ncbi:MAG: EAL domain-containing protein [Lautropia sp.]